MHEEVIQMLKKIAIVSLLLLCLLMGSALAELSGVWGYIGGVKTHGDGLILYADGTGEWLETVNNDYIPASRYLHTGHTFTWEVVQEDDRQFLVETDKDGSVRRCGLRMGAGEIFLSDGADEGEYYDLNEDRVELLHDRLEIISELKAVKGKFTKNKKYDVYQGPAPVLYGRSGNGKGTVSTNGPIYCYGTRNDYLLIEYEISKDKHRYGWIPLEDLPASQADDYSMLDFSKHNGMYTCGVITQDTVLTDDPFYSQSAVAHFHAGTSVFVLMREKDCLLVEGFVGTQQCMGFVPAHLVELKYGYAENVKHTIDQAVTYSKEGILDAMAAVEEAVRQHFSGTSVMELRYIETQSADPTAWWQPEPEENREGMKLLADLDGMSFYDYEIAAYGHARDYGFILYRDKDGGEWEVCNWGYE